MPYAFIAVAVIGFKLLLEFPADIAGRQHRFPEGATYATSAEYLKLIETHAQPAVHLPSLVTVNTAAAPGPDRAVMQRATRAALAPDHQADPAALAAADETAGHEYDRANSQWNLHHRPFFEIEGWVSSLIVLLIFIGGFLKRAPPKT